jgi:rod shape-determining protein MreD
MASRPLADRLLLAIPTLATLAFMLLAAVPWRLFSISVAPQVLWLMVLTVGVAYPIALTPLIAFMLGLVSDSLTGTPIGCQALLAMLMTLVVRAQSRRLQHQLFRVRWMEAVAALLILNFSMWGIIGWAAHGLPALISVLRMTLVSALWFPIFYWMVEQAVKILPPRN